MLGVPWWDALILVFLGIVVYQIMKSAVKEGIRQYAAMRDYQNVLDAAAAVSDLPRPPATFEDDIARIKRISFMADDELDQLSTAALALGDDVDPENERCWVATQDGTIARLSIDLMPEPTIMPDVELSDGRIMRFTIDPMPADES